jgi:rod shape determining protein RodA
MNSLSHKSFRFLPIDWKILLPTILLSILGVITILSTTILPEGGYGDLGIVWKQIISLGLGFILFFIIAFVDLSYLKYWQVMLVIWITTIFLLALTLIIGPEINGTRRWLFIGGTQIQPSEIAKFAVIVITAGIFSMRGKLNELILFGITFISTTALFVLIYLEPGGSMSLLTLAIWFLVTFLALSNPLRNTLLVLILASISGGFLVASITNNWIWYLLIIVGVVLTIFILYSKNNWKPLAVGALVLGLLLGIFFTVSWDKILHDYQKQRIIAFINPTETKTDEGFNVNQSKIAIGSGQLFGKGFGNGTQSKRNFLPEHQTDFIFASFAEEFGLVGCVFVLGLYGFIIIYCFLTAVNVIQNPLHSLICVGVGIKLLLEVFINLGTNMGTIPATGIPLPLMSAGGTITIMTLVCLGLVQNVSIRHKQAHRDKSEEILDVYDN